MSLLRLSGPSTHTHNLFVISSFSLTVTIPEVFLSLRNDINTSCLFEFGGTPLFFFSFFLNVAFLNGPIPPSIPPKIFPYYRSANPSDDVNTPAAAIAAIVASSTQWRITTALVIISFNKRNKSLIGPG